MSFPSLCNVAQPCDAELLPHRAVIVLVYISFQRKSIGIINRFMMNETKNKNASFQKRSAGTPDRIRTGVSALRGPRPRPLDNGGIWLGNKDLNLDSTSQSRKCCRYTIPQCSAASHCKKHYTKMDMPCQGVIYYFSLRFLIFAGLSQASPD